MSKVCNLKLFTTKLPISDTYNVIDIFLSSWKIALCKNINTNMNRNTPNKWILNLGKNQNKRVDLFLNYDTIILNIFVRKDILKC